MATKKFVISIDEGTTSTRALLIDENAKILKVCQEEIEQIYPQAGWVEHNAQEIWDKTLNCSRQLIKEALGEGIANKEDDFSIAITNQRETTILWSAKTGEPVHNAIVWQCRRTSDYCDELKQDQEFSNYVKANTGLIIDAYFSATKIKWISDWIASSSTTPRNDGLKFGTIDSWLIWNFTLGREHLTDTSNASRTMLFNINTNQWDKKLCDKFSVPLNLLPKVINSDGDFGSSPLFNDLLDKEIPIKAVLGDQQAALYAYSNEAKITYGTGTFIMASHGIRRENGEAGSGNTERRIEAGNHRDEMSFPQEDDCPGLVKTIGYKNDIETAYALEGSVFVGGSIVQWLRDELNFIEKSSDIEALALEVEDNGGVYLIPALAGLGAPFWQGDVRGTIFGITRGTNKAHIARAALESIAYRVKDIFDAMDSSIKNKISHINVDGGASQNDTLMQFQADLLGLPIKRYTETEMTALGVAKMTGDIKLELKADKVFQPEAKLDDQYAQWQEYLKKLI